MKLLRHRNYITRVQAPSTHRHSATASIFLEKLLLIVFSGDYRRPGDAKVTFWRVKMWWNGADWYLCGGGVGQPVMCRPRSGVLRPRNV